MTKPKARLDSLDGIAEDATIRLRDCYVQASQEQADRFNDGKPFWLFSLEKAGGWTNVDADHLSRTLEKARKAERLMQRLGDVSPEDAKAALDRVDKLEADLADARKGGKAAVEWEKQKADLVAAHQAELKKAAEETQRIRGELHERVTVAEARRVLADAGFAKHAELMLPAILPALDFQMAENGTPGRFRVLREDGSTERLDPSTGAPLTPLQFAKELAANARYEVLRDGDAASGGGLTGGGGTPPRQQDPKGPVRKKPGEEMSLADIDAIAARGLAYD
jgi:hypothetical protein